MKMHLAAFYQSANSAAALLAINAVQDQQIYTNGTDLRVPPDIANLLAEAALSAQTGPAYGQVQSPSLRMLVNQDVEPIASALVFGEAEQIQWHGDNPRALEGNEAVNFAIDATGGAAAGNYGLIWLADGPVKPTTGKIFSVRATGAAALAAGAWVNTALAFDSNLPAGSYQVVGMRAQGANLVAARLAFVGGGYRPGVPGETDETKQNFRSFRMGRVGVFGEFDINQPPSVDCLGATDTSQVFVLDLIKSK